MSIFNHFTHLSLSPGQETALRKLQSFLESSTPVFMLKGYAGSGKTTILKGLVEYLNAIERDFLLMAPTGRAAKVIREKTGHEAFTIHKSIYSYYEMVEVQEGESFFYSYTLRNNSDIAGKIFIIDEASMLSDTKSQGEFFRFGSGRLLKDLLEYSRVNNINANTKIIFVGDPFQLPPVTDNSSKAFEPKYLKTNFDLSSEETEMKEVKRQGNESGILKIAAKIRKSICAGFYNEFNLRSNGHDVLNPSYVSFLDTWQEVATSKIIIASKNKTCLDINLQIRERKFGNADLPIQKSDIVIMGGNNYRKGIFNGEFAVINNVNSEAETRIIYLKGKSPVTLTWRTVELVFPDSENNGKIVRGRVLENFLYGDNYLKPEETQALYVDFTSRHKDLKPKSVEFKEAIMKDEYFNALLIKYGYAITCHKAQGGEWDNVFTIWDNDNTEGFNCFTDNQIKEGKTNQNFYRWAYTAITRAAKVIYALNAPHFNSYSTMTFIDSEVGKSLNELAGTKVQDEEIFMDVDMVEQLSQYNLLEHGVQFQNHFINVLYAIRKQNIEIVGWERKNLEIWYYFKRETQTAALKTWTNKENVFNGKYQKLGGNNNNESLYSEIEILLKGMSTVFIKRDSVEIPTCDLVFDIQLEEKFPFTKNLFEDLNIMFEGLNIIVENVDHEQYKERYTLKRNQEVVVIDFEYNSKGFFGRIVPIQKQCNSPILISDIQTALQTFKKEEHAS